MGLQSPGPASAGWPGRGNGEAQDADVAEAAAGRGGAAWRAQVAAEPLRPGPRRPAGPPWARRGPPADAPRHANHTLSALGLRARPSCFQKPAGPESRGLGRRST